NVLKRVIFKSRSNDVIRYYTEIFSTLSKKYHAYIVSGSAFIPKLEIDKSHPLHLKNTGRGIYHSSIVFGPDGNALGVTHKKCLVPSETFLDSSDQSPIIVKTPLGNLVTFICADSWSKQLYL